MIALTWNAMDHSVGHEELDKQHKTLLELINQLCVHHQLDDAYFNFVLQELNGYVKNHLQYEEKLLEEAGYHELREHKLSHQKFVDKINAIKDQKMTQETRMDLIKYLMRWWDHHIMLEDMRYKPYISKLN